MSSAARFPCLLPAFASPADDRAPLECHEFAATPGWWSWKSSYIQEAFDTCVEVGHQLLPERHYDLLLRDPVLADRRRRHSECVVVGLLSGACFRQSAIQCRNRGTHTTDFPEVEASGSCCDHLTGRSVATLGPGLICRRLRS